MTALYRSRSLRVALAAVMVSALAAGGYVLLPAGKLTAESVSANKPAPAEALSHANALSEAFRYSADHVLPAVVSIRNEVKPKVDKDTVKRKREQFGQRGGAGPGLPREFGELDPLLKRFFEQMPDFGEMDEMPQIPRMSSG